MDNKNQIPLIAFEEALSEASSVNGSKPAILLGNGFSKSLFKHFNYKKLFDVAKSELDNDNLSEELIAIFNDLKTNDFEKVLAHLNIAEKITKHYGDSNLSHKINADLNNIRRSFIKSLVYIHPDNQSMLPTSVKANTRHLLSKFSKIFTTNYDLLLYWILMSREVDPIQIENEVPHNDGFGYISLPGAPWYENPIWVKYKDQNIFYLHGAFHIFENENIYKVKWDFGENLITQISCNIDQGIYPLIVFEGKHEQKLASVNNNPYLWYSHEELKCLKGTMFILGSSLNQHSDKHIYDSIKSSGLNSVYVGLHLDDDNTILIDNAKALQAQSRKIYFFDSQEAISW